jgi:hypothetical protein
MTAHGAIRRRGCTSTDGPTNPQNSLKNQMENEPYTTRPETSQHGSEPSTTGCPLSYATDRAQVLFGCYRRGDANDPERYVTSIAAVLTLYEADLVREVTDPRSGISTHEKFQDYMPNSGQLKNYCDVVAERRATIARYSKSRYVRPIPQIKDMTPGRRANVFVAATLPQYPKLLAMTQNPSADPADWRRDETRDGIWVSRGWLEGDAPKLAPAWKAPTNADLLTRYGAATAADLPAEQGK